MSLPDLLMHRHKNSCRVVSAKLNFQRCSRESLISLLKVIKKLNRKLLKRFKKKPSQQLRSRFNKRNKFRKKRKLLNKKLLWKKNPKKLSRLLKSKLKMLLKMPLLKMQTKRSIIKKGEKEDQEENTVATTIAEVEEADADLAKMKTVLLLNRAKTRSQEEIIAVDVVAEVVVDVEEAIVQTIKTGQRVNRLSKMSSRLPNRNPRSKRLRKNLLLLRNQQVLLLQQSQLISQQAGTS